MKMRTVHFTTVSVLLLAIFLAGCSGGPPDELFTEQVRKMAALDRGLGFKEEITSVEVTDRIEHPQRYEVHVVVEGWATHPDLTMGATLPASPKKQPSWAKWTFFCQKKEDKSWNVLEKYKVEEGFK